MFDQNRDVILNLQQMNFVIQYSAAEQQKPAFEMVSLHDKNKSFLSLLLHYNPSFTVFSLLLATLTLSLMHINTSAYKV